jgi:glycerol kinase
MKYILAIDQGTTSSRSILFDEDGQLIAVSQKEFTQIFPNIAWVEHDADEIWHTQWFTITDVIKKAKIEVENIVAIGITNQRETVVLWDKTTGKPIYNAIVWQDRRTAEYCNLLKENNWEDYIRENTGLVIDAYFSGTKINWILNNIPEAKHLAKQQNLLFGTIDTWLIWKLTNGKVHATDYSNASRTMLFNIKDLNWDEKLLQEMQIPIEILPEVKNSSDTYGTALIEGYSIPICGVAGDQQAALFGQACFEEGNAKNTYGTGCFMLMNTGKNRVKSSNGLITTIAWGINNEINYALEGSVFIAGAAIQWLRDGLKIIDNADETEQMALSISNNEGVYFVPAFAGLGAPFWDMTAQGMLIGLTRGTSKAHIVRAALEAMAFQTKDVISAMENDSKIELSALNVDGGACKNDFLMQFQSDVLQCKVNRPNVLETTAFGAAALAALYIGIWNLDSIRELKKINRIFLPNIEAKAFHRYYEKWKNAVQRSRNWNQI